MPGDLGINVKEGKVILILPEAVALDPACHNLAEDAILVLFHSAILARSCRELLGLVFVDALPIVRRHGFELGSAFTENLRGTVMG